MNFAAEGGARPTLGKMLLRQSTFALQIEITSPDRNDGLPRFLDDGHIDLDGSTVERFIRPLALNRNYAKRRIMRRCWRQTPKLRRGRRH